MRAALRNLTFGMTAASLLLAGTPAVTAAPLTSVVAESPFEIPSPYDVEGKIESISWPAWTSPDRIDGWIYGGDTVTAVANIPEGATATYEWFEGKDGFAVATGVRTQTYTTKLPYHDIMFKALLTAVDGTTTEQLGVAWVNRPTAKAGTYAFENKPIVGERLYWKVTPTAGPPTWPFTFVSWINTETQGSFAHARKEGGGRFSALVGSDWVGKTLTVGANSFDNTTNPYFSLDGRVTGASLVVPAGKARQGKMNLPSTIRVGDRVKAFAGPDWAETYVSPSVAMTFDGSTVDNESIEQDFVAKDLGKSVSFVMSMYNEADRRYEVFVRKSFTVGLGIVPSSTLKIGSEGKTDTRTAKVGSRIHANLHGGTVLPGQKVAYQWLRGGKSITGATKQAYVLNAADYGKTISFKATTTAPGYTAKTQTPKAGTKVTVATSKPGRVSVTGTRRPGKTVKAAVSSWAPGSKLSYQWLRNGKTIKGATKSSYKLAKADASKNMSVKLTAKRHAYTTVSKTSSTVRIAKK